MPNYKPVAIGFPSRGRPEATRHCIFSGISLAGVPINFFIVFDDPIDVEMCPSMPYVHTRLVPLRYYYVRGVNETYRFMKQSHAEAGEELDFFVICNNDSEFVMPYWGRKAQDAFWELFPDGEGVLELFSGPLVGHYISRASFIDKYLGDRLLSPAYTNHWADKELQEWLERNGKYQALDYRPDQTMISHGRYATQDRVAREAYHWLDFDWPIYQERRKMGALDFEIQHRLNGD